MAHLFAVICLLTEVGTQCHKMELPLTLKNCDADMNQIAILIGKQMRAEGLPVQMVGIACEMYDDI